MIASTHTMRRIFGSFSCSGLSSCRDGVFMYFGYRIETLSSSGVTATGIVIIHSRPPVSSRADLLASVAEIDVRVVRDLATNG